MKISTKGRYALRVMIDLALNDKNEYVSITDISQRQDVSNKYLEQIISLLLKANLIESTRGKMGGYRLKRKPNEYKVGDILRATEGDLAPLDCLNSATFCNRVKDCKSHKFWKGLDDVITKYVDNTTLADILK